MVLKVENKRFKKRIDCSSSTGIKMSEWFLCMFWAYETPVYNNFLKFLLQLKGKKSQNPLKTTTSLPLSTSLFLQDTRTLLQLSRIWATVSLCLRIPTPVSSRMSRKYRRQETGMRSWTVQIHTHTFSSSVWRWCRRTTFPPCILPLNGRSFNHYSSFYIFNLSLLMLVLLIKAVLHIFKDYRKGTMRDFKFQPLQLSTFFCFF